MANPPLKQLAYDIIGNDYDTLFPPVPPAPTDQQLADAARNKLEINCPNYERTIITAGGGTKKKNRKSKKTKKGLG